MGHSGAPAASATVLWTDIAVLLALSWLLGAGLRRLGQPPIVGSLLAGVVAGPSVLGQLWPVGSAWLTPGNATQSALLTAVADFCLLVLLIGLGAETDLPLLRRLGRRAGAVIASSLALPLAGGVTVALLLPASFMGAAGHRSSLVLVVAAAMAVSSLPVIARIMTEMGLTRRDVGQLSIASATVNDCVGFVMLAAAVALVGGAGPTKLIVAIVGLVALVAVLSVVGQRVLDAALRRTRRHGPDIAAGIGVCVTLTMAVAAMAQAFGVDAALGAFLSGIVLGRSRLVPPRVLEVLDWMSSAVFAPLYFATAGLSVDVTLLGRKSAGLWFLVVLAVAFVAKVIGVYTGARLTRLPWRDALGLGVALNGRGALQVIIASAGLSAGILSHSTFTVIIAMSIVSSVAVPPALRWVLRGWKGTEEEQQRLLFENEMSTNVVVRGQRLLLPSRGTTNSVAAARVLDLAWPETSEVTLLRIAGEQADEAGLANVRATLASRSVVEEEAEQDDAVAAILAHANLGYGAIAVGAPERLDAGEWLPAFIEQLLNRSPIPLVLVRRGTQVADVEGRPILRPRRILVPVTGTAASRAGQEVAQTISRNTGADLSLLHVVAGPENHSWAAGRSDRQQSTAEAVLGEARRRAEARRVPTDVLVRDAPFPGEEIERQSHESGADMVIIGTTVSRVGARPYLGQTAAYLLEHVSEPTVVVVVLPDAQQAAADEYIDRGDV
jgi:Kef-type K+ transport system membrane component KefB